MYFTQGGVLYTEDVIDSNDDREEELSQHGSEGGAVPAESEGGAAPARTEGGVFQ